MKILVVDDDVELADMIADDLRAHAHDVVVALDGASALRAVETESVDVIVLDLALPDMTGFDVARLLRAGSLRREAVIALFTGVAGPSFDNATSSGIDLVLRKPLEPEELRRLLGFLHARRKLQLEPAS